MSEVEEYPIKNNWDLLDNPGLPIIYDETCVRCDSWDIRMEKIDSQKVEYICMECNFFWTNYAI